jgi:hypothetical protein
MAEAPARIEGPSTEKRHIAAAVAVFGLMVVAGLTDRWTFTPHGRLDWRVALSLDLPTFDDTFQPDPDVDFEITLPINLVYPISMMLPAEDVRKVEDLEIPAGERSIPARVYWPEAAGASDGQGGPPPVVVYDHGAASSSAAWRPPKR